MLGIVPHGIAYSIWNSCIFFSLIVMTKLYVTDKDMYCGNQQSTLKEHSMI